MRTAIVFFFLFMFAIPAYAMHVTVSPYIWNPAIEIYFFDDFIGAYQLAFFPSSTGTSDDLQGVWDILATNLNTPVESVLSAAGGVVRIIADADNNPEEGTLYFTDSLVFRLNQGLVFECRCAFPTLPTTVGGELTTILFGLASATAAIPDNITINAWFRLEGGGTGAILWETDNNIGGGDDDDNATGVSATAGTFYIFRIDFSNLAAVQFTINGVLVGTSNMTGLLLPNVQPYFRVNKAWAAANTSQGSLDLDYVKIWQQR